MSISVYIQFFDRRDWLLACFLIVWLLDKPPAIYYSFLSLTSVCFISSTYFVICSYSTSDKLNTVVSFPHSQYDFFIFLFGSTMVPSPCCWPSFHMP